MQTEKLVKRIRDEYGFTEITIIMKDDNGDLGKDDALYRLDYSSCVSFDDGCHFYKGTTTANHIPDNEVPTLLYGYGREVCDLVLGRYPESQWPTPEQEEINKHRLCVYAGDKTDLERLLAEMEGLMNSYGVAAKGLYLDVSPVEKDLYLTVEVDGYREEIDYMHTTGKETEQELMGIVVTMVDTFVRDKVADA